MARLYSLHNGTRQKSQQRAKRGWASTRAFTLLVALVACTAGSTVVRIATADPNYIENLTFVDRSPGSPRAKPYASVLRLDANDTSFAGQAGWGGGFSSWQQQFDHTKALAASHPNSGLVFIGDSVTQNWGNVEGRQVNGSGAN